MYLCFGTLAGVLFLCGIKPIKKTKLLHTIVRSVDGTCELSASAVTWLLQCEANLPDDTRSNSKGAVISKSQQAEPRKVAEYFAKKVVSLIDPNKRKLAVLAILDIITNDDSIREDTVVELVSGATKKALRKQSRFVLSDFLAGIFLYTTSVDNRIGKDATRFIGEDYIQSFIGMQDMIAFIVPQSESDVEAVAEAFNAYLVNAEDKYGRIKTLLYKDQPQPFYNFYIPNNINHSIGRDRNNLLKDVTAETLTNISNFIILSGDGGIGKTMMMRHLLLDAIRSFCNFRHIPVFIPLKDYNETGTLVDIVYIKTADLNRKITRDAFERALTDGDFLLLFDGLDEIKAESSRRFERELEAFTDKYPKNRYVISSRPYQQFVSFLRFSVMRILPFTQTQSLTLIDRLEFRPDEPAFKKKFRSLLEGSLYNTHRSFIENPLLLTIMLMTFEKFAAIPTKMHIFYRNAYITLAETHDATKGGFKRISKSGLIEEIFADYFAEFCFHTYKDYKFEFTEEEFAGYYNRLISNEPKVTTASSFAYDLCANLCLMYLEGYRYHFMHRSFQEYFCALFFSKQKDMFLARLGVFFENRHKQMRGDNTLRMLYDMIPNKVETNIFIPYLQELFEECDAGNGYWTFLEKMYPCIRYDKGEVNDYSTNAPVSFLFDFIIKFVNPEYDLRCDDLPEDDTLVIKEYGYVYEEGSCRSLVDIDKIPEEYPWVEEEPDVVGGTYEFELTYICSRPLGYKELQKVLDDDAFIFKSEYNATRAYFEKIKEKQLNTDEGLLALL